jgi:hypothetical protein
MPSRPMSENPSPRGSTAGRSANLGEGSRTERLSRLRKLWRVIRAHLIGEVPITKLDLEPNVSPSDRTAPSVPPAERPAAEESHAARDNSVDEASDESFPASDPPSFTASRV